ncbi:MAG: BACON domain-containing protein, partial [Alistipes sp.]|nr:BACON domain-containing protein [Alistipes sp.]
MKKLFLLLAFIGIVGVGCSKEEVDKGNDVPENIFFGLDKESVTISPDGGSVDVVVYSNYKWEISGTSDWCTPSVKGGDANEDGQKVTFSADVAYDDREATFWFRCANERIKFVVSQKLKAVIIPDANNSFNIPADGGIAVISYQTSVDCEVIIPEEAKDWITIAPATRGLVSENINLDIA